MDTESDSIRFLQEKGDLLFIVLATSSHLLVRLGTGKIYDSCDSDLTINSLTLPHRYIPLFHSSFCHYEWPLFILCDSIFHKFTFIFMFMLQFLFLLIYYWCFSDAFIHPFTFDISKSLFLDVLYVAYSCFVFQWDNIFFYWYMRF